MAPAVNDPGSDELYREVGQVLERISDAPTEERAGLIAEIENDGVRTKVTEMLDRESSGPSQGDSAGSVHGFDAVDALLRLVGIGPGATVGPYRLEHLIDRGGMACVWAGVHKESEQRVAIKMLPPRTASDQLESSLKREARLLGILEHDGIAAIHNAGVHACPGGDLPWFALELVPGALPLDEYVAPLALESRLRAFLQLCTAMRYAHKSGVLHLDLKPSNVLVRAAADGRDAQVKVIDFGIARSLNDEAEDRARPYGTPAYMSPERLRMDRGAERVPADIYSLGVILYELSTGRRPTAGAEPPGHSPPGDLDGVVRKALAQAPSDRYETVLDLERDVEAFLAFRPTAARGADALHSLALFARRRRGWIILSTVFLLVGTGTTLLVRDGFSRRIDALSTSLANVQSAERSKSRSLLESVKWLTTEIATEGTEGPFLSRGPAGKPRALRLKGLLDEIVDGQRARSAGPGDRIELRILRSALAVTEGDFALVLELLRGADLDALRTSPKAEQILEEAALLLRGQALRKTNDPAGALACCERYLELQPSAGSLWVIKANILGPMGRKDEALRAYDRAIALMPMSSWAAGQRAQARYWFKDLAGAATDYDRAVELAPEDAHLRFNFAVTLDALGRRKEALSQLDIVAVQSPEMPIVFMTRGRIHFNLGDDAGALADMNRAIDMDGEPPQSWLKDRDRVSRRLDG